MTNVERQKSLYNKRIKRQNVDGYDFSGLMPYCEFCDCANDLRWEYCAYSDYEMNEKCKCAKAFNRMVRSNNDGC